MGTGENVVSLKPLNSFSSGELDPILHDHVTLDKFKKGLATCRNTLVSKTGGLLSRFSRGYFKNGKNSGEQIKLFSPPNSSALLVWGNLYVRTYAFDGTLVNEVAHAYNEAQVQTMHFTASGKYVYAFVAGQEMLKFLYDDATPAFVTSADVFAITEAPTSMSITANGTPTGYSVDYLVTKVKNGEESLPVAITGTTYKKPLAAGESNTITVNINTTFAGDIDEYSGIRVYRRPNNGGSYGFIGSSSITRSVSTNLFSDFEDLGGNADFTNNPQELITKSNFSGVDLDTLNPKTGVVYQQRLLIGNITDDEEAILASRPAFQNNFYRDRPYDADSALKFKSGTSGKASVLRMVENDGLIVFTNVGVFVSVGSLSIDNIALEKKGNWIIDENVEPLAVPGGVFFVDKSTNSVRQLIYSQDILTYQSLDQSIFSDHLFKESIITSWAYQSGVVPMIIVTFNDGTFASFTYHYEHQMRAWTRHDSVYPVESVIGTGVADSTFFVTNKSGVRQIEVTLPRHTPAATILSNPDYKMFSSHAFMDAIKTYSYLLNDSLVGTDVFTLTPVVANTWDGDLTLDCGTSALLTTGGATAYLDDAGDVGAVHRVFASDGTAIDLTITARASNNSVTVTPDFEYPSTEASSFRLYQTFSSINNLDHLEGEQISLLTDGAVAKSPNNDIENYGTTTILLGVLILPKPSEAEVAEVGRHAIVIAGRPITADIKTLNISTVSQQPTLIESININKLYIRVHKTRGLYVSNEFPEEAENGVDGSSVLGMENLDIYQVPRGNDILGNRFLAAQSKRIEQVLKGSWKSQGQIALRQVDPVNFEILSIIPDVEVLNRSNR